MECDEISKITALSADRTAGETDCRTIQAIPAGERPYEKCIAYGAEFLSDSELIAVILRTGSRGESSLSLARYILEQAGGRGLTGLYHMSYEELIRIRGVGKVKAVQLKCIAELSRRIARQQNAAGLSFSSPDTIAAYYMEEMRHLEQEILMVLMLNSKNMLIQEELLSKGTVRGAMISPREIYISALRCRAVGIILLHNHPSGQPQPSEDDIFLTRRVMESGQMLGIELLDHIIIGDRVFYSMKNEGII